MRNRFPIVFLLLALACAGCGPSKTEREAQERQRLELEEKQRLEAERANKAITEMNKKLGRKVPLMDLGLPSEKQPAPAPDKPKQP